MCNKTSSILKQHLHQSPLENHNPSRNQNPSRKHLSKSSIFFSPAVAFLFVRKEPCFDSFFGNFPCNGPLSKSPCQRPNTWKKKKLVREWKLGDSKITGLFLLLQEKNKHGTSFIQNSIIPCRSISTPRTGIKLVLAILKVTARTENTLPCQTFSSSSLSMSLSGSHWNLTHSRTCRCCTWHNHQSGFLLMMDCFYFTKIGRFALIWRVAFMCCFSCIATPEASKSNGPVSFATPFGGKEVSFVSSEFNNTSSTSLNASSGFDNGLEVLCLFWACSSSCNGGRVLFLLNFRIHFVFTFTFVFPFMIFFSVSFSLFGLPLLRFCVKDFLMMSHSFLCNSILFVSMASFISRNSALSSGFKSSRTSSSHSFPTSHGSSS